MASAAQRSRGGPGFLGMIIFLSLSILLAGACVFLFLGYSKRGASLNKLQSAIKKDLEDPLGKAIGVSALPVASASDAAYDDSFFLKVQRAASDGVKYNALVTATGYAGEDPVKDINDELQKVQPNSPENLRAYVAKLTQDKGDLQRQLKEGRDALALSAQQTHDAQEAQATDSKALKVAVDKSVEDLKNAEDAHVRDMASTKQRAATSAKEAREAWDKKNEEAEAHKKETAALQDTITKQKDEIDALTEELNRKRPKAVAVTEGHILTADFVEGVAIIDLGKKEQIQNGEKFTVIRISKTGERKPKAELQVVRVDELVSTALIIKSDPDEPVMRDDLVEREKKTEEAPTAATAH